MDRITVNLDNRSYPICFGYNNLAEIGRVVKEFGFSERIAVVTNPEVSKLFLNIIEKSLQDAGFNVFPIEIPDGEETKSLEWTSILYDKLISLKMDRKSALVALGGGVIGDVTGFVAATFLRGIPYIQVPTTLLAQVDSSVGGKTGVNHSKGKNLIGAFYQPSLVFIDVNTLKTLPESEFVSGLAEVIKYGIIRDLDLFEDLENNLERILGLDQEYVLKVVKRCCSIKAKIVEEDEKESGVRSILNFGHTLGHAIEVLTNYKGYKHGEAVAIGMVVAIHISVESGVCNKDAFYRVKGLIQKAGLPTELPEFSRDEYISVIKLDKKMGNNKVKFVMLEHIGRVKFTDLAAEDISRYL
ncbi:MAG: 3-dehydroquinate synthase [Pseudomonadota bacterium]